MSGETLNEIQYLAAAGQVRAGVGTPAAVAASATAVTILAANPDRKSASVYYDGSAILYLVCSATTPTSALFTLKMGDGYLTYFEAPAGYTGIIQGIWASASGSALVTEYV